MSSDGGKFSFALGAAAATAVYAAYRLWDREEEDPQHTSPSGGSTPSSTTTTVEQTSSVIDDDEASSSPRVDDWVDDFLCVRYFASSVVSASLDGKVAADIPYDRVAAEVNVSTTVRETMMALLENDSSCVVVRVEAEWGILDLTDLVPFLLTHSLDRCIGDVVRKAVLISERTRLADVLRHLQAGWRYTLVVGKITPWSQTPQVLSQGSLLRHLSKDHLEHPSFDATLEERGLGGQRERLLVCRRGTTAAEAYRAMASHEITSLPCVDDEGNIEAVVSFTDAKCLATMASDEVDTVLSLEGRRFARQSQRVADGGEARVVTCTPQETLRGVVERMVTEAVHHVYVCPPGSRSVEGVVSIVDVLKSL